MFTYIFYALATMYIIVGTSVALWVYKHIENMKRLSRKNESPETIEEFKLFRRPETLQLNSLYYAMGGLVFAPVRIMIIIVNLILLDLVIKLFFMNTKSVHELQPWRKFFLQSMIKFIARTLLFTMGFYYIEKKKRKISEFDPTYEGYNPQNRKEAAMMIANHQSWADSFYTASQYCPAFLGKSEVSKLPIFGLLGECMDFLWVEREDRQQKNTILDKISERIDRFYQPGSNMSPLLIFPEGTTSNGLGLLTFKKGAFFKLAPIKAVCLEYPDQDFNAFIDSHEMFSCIILATCRFKNTLIEHEFETFYPPRDIDPKSEDAWLQYAERIRNVMAKCLRIPATNKGLHDYLSYSEIYLNGRTRAEAVEYLENKHKQRQQKQQNSASNATPSTESVQKQRAKRD